MGDKLKSLISSRRFWVSALGIYNLAYGDVTPLLDTIQAQGDLLLTTIISAWVVGDSLRKTE